MEREWRERANWLNQAERMNQEKSSYWHELQTQEKSLIDGYLNLYTSKSDVEDEAWGSVHRELNDFYHWGQHEPIPFEGTKVYAQLDRWTAEHEPTGWAWHPEYPRKLEQGLKRRGRDLDTLLGQGKSNQAPEKEGETLGGRKGEEKPPGEDRANRGGGGGGEDE